MNIHKVSDWIERKEMFAAQSRNTGAVNGAAILDLTKYHGNIELDISAGTFGSGATLDVKWQESDNADMSSPSDVTGGALAQKTAAGFWTLSLDVRKFTKRYIRPVATVGTAAIVFSGVTVAQLNETGASV